MVIGDIPPLPCAPGLLGPRGPEEIEANGLQLTSFEGFDRRIASNQLTLSEDPSILGNTGVVLVTVKSADTAEIADVIAQHAPADAVIVSLQNGVGDVSLLRQRLPGRRVLAGMVPFHVIAPGEGRVHRATSGDIVIEQDEGGTAKQPSVTWPKSIICKGSSPRSPTVTGCRCRCRAASSR